MTADDDGAVTMHSTWRGIIGAQAGAALILAAGVFGGILGDWRTFSVVLTVIGAIATLGVAADYPIATTFTAEGAHRHTLLRRQFLAWDRVRQLSRTRVGVVAGMRKTSLGGLVAAVGRRRYLLVDQGESAAEFDRLVQIVGEVREEALALDVLRRPSDEAAPTWLYRKAKWAPDGLGRR